MMQADVLVLSDKEKTRKENIKKKDLPKLNPSHECRKDFKLELMILDLWG